MPLALIMSTLLPMTTYALLAAAMRRLNSPGPFRLFLVAAASELIVFGLLATACCRSWRRRSFFTA